MSEYFPEPKSSGGKVKVELDLSNYATKADLKNATCADASKCTRKVDLTSLKSTADKLDIDKWEKLLSSLMHVPVDLNRLSDVVKKDVVKKDVYNSKIKNINITIILLLR